MIKRNFLSYKKAHKFVLELNLKNTTSWFEYCKSGSRPENIPSVPWKAYKNKGWKSLVEWVGRDFISYNEAQIFISKLGLKNYTDWKEYCESNNRPKNIPSAPWKIYKNNGWNGMAEWLGNKNAYSRTKGFLSYDEAQKFVSKLRLKKIKIGWDNYCKSGNRPGNIPAAPWKVYKNKGWKSMREWLGKPKTLYLSYNEARQFVAKLGLKSISDWKKYCNFGNKPKSIPVSPIQMYKNNGWINWAYFFGKKTTFKELKNIVRNHNIKSKEDYYKFCKSINYK